VIAEENKRKSNDEQKLYYSIGEVADMFSVNTSLIRFWEKEFDLIKPKRNIKGTRFFSTKDVENFHLIYNLVKERGYTLRGAKEKIKKNPEEVYEDFEMINTLKKIRKFLLEVKKEL